MGHGPALIEPERPTLAATLREHGYRTAAVGKWHLGLGWRQRDGSVWDARRAGDPLEYQLGDPLARHRARGLDSGDGIDYTQPFTGGPTDLGFDYFFGIAGSLNMPPYAFLRQDRTLGIPDRWKTRFLPGQRAGLEAVGWDEHAVDLQFTERATRYLTEHDGAAPFFLYFAPSAPHRPQVPPGFLRGASRAGVRGDSVVFLDWMVGRLIETLRVTGRLDDTFVVITSDNGAPLIFRDERDEHHRPNGPWRGQKGDAWDGGHREPLILRWPGHIPGGVRSDSPLDLVDLYRTICTLVGVTVPDVAAPDGMDRSAALGVEYSPHPGLRVQASMGGALCAVAGPWKVIFAPGSGGGLSADQTQSSQPIGQLYNLRVDPAETDNLWAGRPDVVAALRRSVGEIVGDEVGFLAPGRPDS